MNEIVQTLIKQRENIYRFLSRLYLLEVDEALLEILKHTKFTKSDEFIKFSEGSDKLSEAISKCNTTMLDSLAADYARLFLAAGSAQGQAAFPYESVYTNKDHMVMQDSRSDIAVLFAEKGLKPSEKLYKVPEDHIALELEYMAVLCAQCSDENIEENLKEQSSFFNEHLINWVPAFTKMQISCAETAFYQALGEFTEGFIEMEETFFSTVIAEK